MGPNKATQTFFNHLLETFKKNPSKSLSEQTIYEYRSKGRELFGALAGNSANISDEIINIQGRSGNSIPIRIFNNDLKGILPALIFFPGGGFVANLETHAVPCSRIAENTGCRVIMVNCRLAPENPFPDGLEDAYDAYKWIIQNAINLGIDLNKIMLGGDSSGGNFAALLAIKARDEELPLAHQFLISPATDLSRSINTHAEYEKYDMLLSNELTSWAYNKYLGDHIDPKNAEVSPYWHSNLANLAPSTIIVAQYDGIRSDSEAYAKKLKEVGNNCKLIVCDGQVHSFLIARVALFEGEDPVDIITKGIHEIKNN